MRHRDISAAVIRRLPRYYRYLGELLQNDVVRISSKRTESTDESNRFADTTGFE